MLAYMAPFWSSARMRRLLALISCQPKTKYNILEEKVVAQRPLWTYKMCYTLFFSRKILTSFSHLILGRQKPPLGVFLSYQLKKPLMQLVLVCSSIGFEPSNLYAEYVRNLQPSAEEKICRMEMRKGSEWTLKHCFVESTISRNFFCILRARHHVFNASETGTETMHTKVRSCIE